MSSAIIAERVFDADHIYGGASTNSAGTSSREYSAGREARPATPGSTNTGSLNPTPAGAPDADVDIDVILRSSGNVDGARWGYKDHSNTVYRGKQPASILSDIQMLLSTSSTGTRLSRPKLLPLASGALLLMWVRGSSGNGGDGVYYRIWTKAAGWAQDNVNNQISLGVTMDNVLGIDAVQMPDNGEIVLMINGYLSTPQYPVLQRMTAPDSYTAGLLGWRHTPTKYQQTSIGTHLHGIAMEVMQSGRIAMILHSQASGLKRTYSDDRGASWATWKNAGQYTQEDMIGGCTLDTTGGVALCRARSGSLIAVAPAISGTFSSATGWTEHSNPRLRILVSDDGDSYNDMIVASASADGLTDVVTQADGLLEEGCAEGALAVGDDGLPRLFGCLHGASNGTTSTSFYDELCTVSLRKQDVTAKDVGLGLTRSQAYAIASAASFVFTCSDAFDSFYYDQVGAYVPTKANLTLSRMFSINGDNTGQGSNSLNSSPQFRGVRYVDVVNFRGALWVVMVMEDTGTPTYSLVAARCNAWSELFELPGDCTDTTKILKGRPYQIGMIAGLVPEKTGWIKLGTGTVTLDATTGGVKVVSATEDVHWENTTSPLPGTNTKPAIVAATCKAISGGSSTDDNIALTVQLSDSTHFSKLSIRFTEAGGVYVVDSVAASTLGSATGLDVTYGVEVRVGYSNSHTLCGVFVRSLKLDPEDAVWQSITLSGTALDNTSVGVSEAVQFGNQNAAASASSTWRNVQFNRGSTSGDPLPGSASQLALNSYTSSTYLELLDGNGYSLSSYDDGLRHGTRPLPCASSQSQYARKQMYMQWFGSAGATGDTWEAISKSSYDVSRIRRAPVGDFWRSNDDDSDSYIVFDSGTADPITSLQGELFRPEAIAFFGLNAASITVQLNSTNSWGSPAVSIVCDTTDSADVRRDYWRRTSNFTTEGTGNNTVRLTSDTSTPMAPHQFRSTTRQKWYLYSAALNQSFTILDNDNIRLFLDGSANGAVGSSIAIYTDRIAFAVAGGTLSTTGYRYMRLKISSSYTSGGVLPEGYQKLGMVISGRKFDLSSPHPEWGWTASAAANIATTQTQGGYVDARQLSEALRSWKFGFTGMQDRRDRTALTAAPGQRGGWQELLDFMDAVRHGEDVFALMPEYNDSIADGNYTTFGKRCLDVYPARLVGPWSGTHQAYEGCRTGDGLIKSILDIGAIEFNEVL